MILKVADRKCIWERQGVLWGSKKVWHNEGSYSEWEKAEDVHRIDSNIFQYIKKSSSELNFSIFAIYFYDLIINIFNYLLCPLLIELVPFTQSLIIPKYWLF